MQFSSLRRRAQHLKSLSADDCNSCLFTYGFNDIEVNRCWEYSVLFRSGKFWTILSIGITLVGIQGVCAYIDGYFSQAQIRTVHGIHNAYSFKEHGGMWADVLIVTPIVSYIATTYRLKYWSMTGILILALAIFVSLAAGYLYQEMGKTIPEAHTHFGYTPLAGWIHGLFAVATIWICVMFYLTPVTPQPGFDMIAISIGLTALFILGVKKFNPNWNWSKGAIIQVAILIALVWGATAYKLLRGR